MSHIPDHIGKRSSDPVEHTKRRFGRLWKRVDNSYHVVGSIMLQNVARGKRKLVAPHHALQGTRMQCDAGVEHYAVDFKGETDESEVFLRLSDVTRESKWRHGKDGYVKVGVDNKKLSRQGLEKGEWRGLANPAYCLYVESFQYDHSSKKIPFVVKIKDGFQCHPKSQCEGKVICESGGSGDFPEDPGVDVWVLQHDWAVLGAVTRSDNQHDHLMLIDPDPGVYQSVHLSAYYSFLGSYNLSKFHDLFSSLNPFTVRPSPGDDPETSEMAMTQENETCNILIVQRA